MVAKVMLISCQHVIMTINALTAAIHTLIRSDWNVPISDIA